MTLHVYRAPKQPATRYLDHAASPPLVIRRKPHQRIRTVCCKRVRIACNLLVQAYYHGDYYTCRPGKGCKRRNGAK